MKQYLLDTDTCIYALKHERGVLGRMLAKPRESVHLSVVTESELRFGVAKSRSASRALPRLESFLRPLQVLEYGSDDAIAYARIRAHLERSGKPIGPLDTLIAAHAVARGLILVTNNQREFTRVPGLDVDNWAD
ncbi:MAG: type II toxin-antitoxin system VapC family toxin [Nannocystaceae bacterium]